MKIVINKCFGGFSLSPIAIALYAKRKGKTAYFFKDDFYDGIKHVRVDMPEQKDLFWSAYSVPNPDEYTKNDKQWYEMTDSEKKEHNKKHTSISLYSGDIPRTDEDLIFVVESLGSQIASGRCAELKVVEIPDGVQYEIDEYDGLEHIAEVHRTWG